MPARLVVMSRAQISRTTIAAVVLATIAALFVKSWLQITLVQGGVEKVYAANLAFLVVPPILLILLFPVFLQQKAFLAGQFQRKHLTLNIALASAAIGVLLRLAWWAQLTTGVSFGLYRNPDLTAITGPVITFQCATAHVVILGFVVMAVMVPIVEEVTHRAFIQTALYRFGAVIAITTSALVFLAFHRPSGWMLAFSAGLIFGIQYWRAGSLWPSVISHATFNGLVQIDWRCLQVQWNPPQTDLPLWLLGLTSGALFAACIGGISYLLWQVSPGPQHATRG